MLKALENYIRYLMSNVQSSFYKNKNVYDTNVNKSFRYSCFGLLSPVSGSSKRPKREVLLAMDSV